MQIGPDTYLVEDPDHPSLDDFLNHSCEPNLGFITGSLILYALRNIQAGEELFFDYSTTMNEPDWTIKCCCRTDSCRAWVRSYCDLSKDERRRLKNIALRYLRRTIKRDGTMVAAATGSRRKNTELLSSSITRT
jgi:SET domain-containing protein